MKKINSNGYGLKVISGAAIFLIVIPAICYLFYTITELSQFQLFVKISLAFGSIILLFLFISLKIEFSQDKKIDEYFMENKKSRLPLKNGLFECQVCGNNQIKPEQKCCIICGTNFRNWSEDDGNKRQQ